MLLDEITSALDPELVLDIMNAIRSLRADGISLVLVSHHVEFVMSVCDRIMFLDAGRVAQVGTPNELRAADGRVRSFLEVLRSVS